MVLYYREYTAENKLAGEDQTKQRSTVLAVLDEKGFVTPRDFHALFLPSRPRVRTHRFIRACV